MSTPNQIKILGADQEHIQIEVNGEKKQIDNSFDVLQQIIQQEEATVFQSADKIYNIKSINQANFYFVIDRVSSPRALPEELSQTISLSGNQWIESLKEELKEQANISIGNKLGSVFNHYGWLIETFLLKIASKVSLEDHYRRLSFMTEAYQSSLRYLAYIQLAQVIAKPLVNNDIDFFEMQAQSFEQYDFINSLWQTSKAIGSDNFFIPEMKDFIEELFDQESELHETALYLEQIRSKLITNTLPKDKNIEVLLEEYLTALVHWLRTISFLAQYRLVSIKDVSLNYQLGTPKHYIHTFGELHGMYDESASDFSTRTLEDLYTYSRSVLLFKGSSIEAGLSKIIDSKAYLSLSPLIIDQSVYRERDTQTPEIYYYTGKGKRQFSYAQYRNELKLDYQTQPRSNKYAVIKKQNTQQPKWNKLYKQIDHIFNQSRMS